MDEGGCGGRARGSAMRVTAWQSAHRMDPAPGGTCRGVRQLEQFTSRLLYMAAVGNLGKMVGAELGFREALFFFFLSSSSGWRRRRKRVGGARRSDQASEFGEVKLLRKETEKIA